MRQKTGWEQQRSDYQIQATRTPVTNLPFILFNKKTSPHSVVSSGTFCLPVGVEFLFWTVWRESLSPWQPLVMNKIKGNLALVSQHRVILASRGHGGEAVRILYLETRGRGVVSFIRWQFCGRRKNTKVSKCIVVWVNYIAGLDAARKKKHVSLLLDNIHKLRPLYELPSTFSLNFMIFLRTSRRVM